MNRIVHFTAALILITLPAIAQPAGAPPPNRLPTLYIIGDSTVKNGSGKGADGLWGWGDPIAADFDPSKIRVVNRALGGRSSRTYLTEGLWSKVQAELRPGDFVLMQFGHNDGGPLSGPKARASIKGNGEETKEITDDKTGKKETVHSYGWYLRQYIKDAKAKGATPIVLSPIPRNMWKDDKVLRAANDYGKWAAQAAADEGVRFIDLNALIADRYDHLGLEKVKAFFPGDHTHTNKDGARFNATVVTQGIQALKDCPLRDTLAAGVHDSKP